MATEPKAGELDLNAEIDALPDAERNAIDRRAAELDREVRVLKEVRKLADKSQKDVAVQLGIAQPSVSKMEAQADMYLSTLRAYIEALGGSLTFKIQLPNAEPVEVEDLLDLSGQTVDGAAADASSKDGMQDGGDPVASSADATSIADPNRTSA